LAEPLPIAQFPIVRLTNVHLDMASDAGTVNILRGITLAIAAGEITAVVGPSGAGKSSLMMVAGGLERATSGKVEVVGNDMGPMGDDDRARLRRDHIGIVFQEFRLLGHLTTFENVALPLRVLGQNESSYRANVTELLDWVGLGERMDALPALLSGGEKQRAAIARAVIGRPDILLADEPTGNVDPDLSLRLVRLFAELNKMGTTIILATHELELLEKFPFPRMELRDGQVVFGG